MYKLSPNQWLLINSHYQIRASAKVKKKTYIIHRPFVLSNWTDNTEETLVLNFFLKVGSLYVALWMFISVLRPSYWLLCIAIGRHNLEDAEIFLLPSMSLYSEAAQLSGEVFWCRIRKHYCS